MYIRKNIPSGQAVRSSLHESLEDMNAFASESGVVPELSDAGNFKNELRKLCEKQGNNPERVFASLGTLGGGNHFIEIDVDETSKYAINEYINFHKEFMEQIEKE